MVRVAVESAPGWATAHVAEDSATWPLRREGGDERVVGRRIRLERTSPAQSHTVVPVGMRSLKHVGQRRAILELTPDLVEGTVVVVRTGGRRDELLDSTTIRMLAGFRILRSAG